MSWLLLGLGYLAPLWTEKRQTFQDSLASWVPQLVERSRCLDACLGAGIGLSACWEPCV